ncbi:hypothetical protein ASPCAL03334 [Aspergillus calidoustus]|uniref:Uncharacterized protein n=1 Tax=Aspergillus calidoustus TaxID=454130 RepID=A0A0U5FRK8_ASPCI|nr:hypothetical protein ASPCAL03334 [Aspergillus calidoustus]
MKLPALSLLLSGVLAIQSPPPLNNANHIFNAIHSSTRQWGASIHHNGMSFFLATVPAGVRLYHGNADPTPIRDIGWMALEPEHAMVFARPRPHRPRDGPPPDPSQNVLQQGALSEGAERETETGWLHTYDTTRELRLLYIDGTSAGKSKIGTLDLQDRVLFNDTFDGGVSMEDERARKVCELARTEWNGRLDGAIRMAAGFEIILCRPDNTLGTVKIMPVRRQENGNSNGPGKSSELLRAITSRFNGIGGDRVRVYYDHFVSAYTFDLNLWPDNSSGPRMQHLSVNDLSPISDDLTRLIMDHEPDIAGSVNWQSVADLIVARYGRFLQGLVHRKPHAHRKEHDDEPQMKSPQAQISDLMAGFGNDPKESTALCSTQFLSVPTDSSPLAHQALYTISHQICSTLVSLRSQTDDETVRDTVHQLMGYLDWTVWKECRACRGDEFCAIPIWPRGSKKDFEKPKCRKLEEGWGRVNDYWGEIWH